MNKGKLLGAALALLLSAPLAWAGSATTTFSATYPAAVSGPTVVQNLGDKGGASVLSNQICSWRFTQSPTNGTAIKTGDTIIGFFHQANAQDTSPMYPQSANLTGGTGGTQALTLTPNVLWSPFPEDIGMFYLTNIQGNPTTINANFQQYTNSGNTELQANSCMDAWFTEYTPSTVNAVVNPVLTSGNSPSLTITPTAPSLIWAFASPYTNDVAGAMTTPGYSLMLNDLPTDDIGVWGSNSLVPAGAQTLTWDAPEGATSDVCLTGPTRSCPTVVMAAAISAATPPPKWRHPDAFPEFRGR